MIPPRYSISCSFRMEGVIALLAVDAIMFKVTRLEYMRSMLASTMHLTIPACESEVEGDGDWLIVGLRLLSGECDLAILRPAQSIAQCRIKFHSQQMIVQGAKQCIICHVPLLS